VRIPENIRTALVLVVLAGISIWLVTWADLSPTDDATQSRDVQREIVAATNKPAATPDVKATKPIPPAGLTYREFRPEGKASSSAKYIRLSRRLDDKELWQLASFLDHDDVLYYLPGMKVGVDIYAMSGRPKGVAHPPMEAKLWGLSKTAVSEVIAARPLPKGAIGRWVDDAFHKAVITIYKEDSWTYIEYAYAVHAIDRKELKQLKHDNGNAFQVGRTSHPDAYYLVTKKGTLEARDEEGLIYTCLPVNPDPSPQPQSP